MSPIDSDTTRPDHDELPSHIAFGLLDESFHGIDEYAAAVQGRLDEVVDISDADSLVVELVLDALPYEASPESVEDIERQLERLRIISMTKHKRKFGRPVLNFASIHHPSSRR